ncbi:MAG TPA: 3-isopropylmalate dehydrogenase [Chloroflexota bacterium]|nr:3-isopropylmalate dehydrogenase [Chloroflexota bacterium]
MSEMTGRSGRAEQAPPLIAVLPGDGIGPEVVEQGLVVLRSVAARFDWRYRTETALVGGAAIDATGDPLPPETLALSKRADAVYFGAVGGPKWDDPRAAVRPEGGILALRKGLGLYANLRPVKLFPALLHQSVLKEDVVRGTDMIVVRELTGGLYFGKPSRRWETSRGWRAVDTLAYTEAEIERVLRTGFELARGRRKRLTSVDKANVLTTGRFWREIATRVGRDYPDVELEHILVDSAAMYLMRRPATFDVMVTENMFGDILTDEAAVLAGSMGMLPSASLGETRNRGGGVRGLYEPIHGTALYTPEVVGSGKANPIAAVLSLALMLRYSFGQEPAALAVEAAVQTVLDEGYRTADIASGPAAAGPGERVVTTTELGALIAERAGRVRITAPAAA